MKLGLPNQYGIVSLISGLFACILYTSQLLWGCFAPNFEIARIIFSLAVILVMCFAIAAGREAAKQRDWTHVAKNTFMYASIVIISVLILQICGMGLDISYANEAKDAGLGPFYGFQMLASVTQDDLTGLANWGIGLKIILKALFLITPFLIATWGGIAVLTADDMQEASTGIYALLAAIIFSLIIWIFKLADIILY